MLKRVSLAVLFGLLVLAAGTAADPAIVVHDGFCGMPGVGPNGQLGGAPGGVATGTAYHKVENGSKVMLSCTGEVTNLSGKGQQYSIGCGIIIPSGGFAIDPDAFYNVSATGQANLKCVFKK